MSYDVSVVNLGLRGEPTCAEQHAMYKKEHARVSALAAQLGPVAAECHRLHGEYNSAASAYEEMQRKNAECQATMSAYTTAANAHKKGVADKKACDEAKSAHASATKKYDAAVKEYKAWVEAAITKNAASKAKYDAAYKSADTQNYAIGQHNKGLEIGYAQRLAIWQRQTDAYKLWRQNVAGQAQSAEVYLQQQIQNNPSLKNHKFTYTTFRCGTQMKCMTQARKVELNSTCIAVRGLGSAATSAALDICLVRKHYQTCPTDCPPEVAKPGAAPVAGTPLPYLPMPKVPDYISIISLDDYLKSKGVQKPGNTPTCAPVVPPAPKHPSCDPNGTLPAVPPKPTCTPPEIPAMPSEPTCKPSVFGQVGTMWLLLAAGAGGLYWYSKKK